MMNASTRAFGVCRMIKPILAWESLSTEGNISRLDGNEKESE
jgi:hypothetical protein